MMAKNVMTSDLTQQLGGILEEFGLEAATAAIVSMSRPGIRVRRTPLPTDNWPDLFQKMSLQIRAHHEKQGEGGHVIKRKPKAERAAIEVPDGPLTLKAGECYYAIGEYLTREVLPEIILPLGTSRLGGQPDMPAGLAWPSWDVPARTDSGGVVYRESAGECKLTFLGQINFAELQASVPASELPADGLLLFFFDATNEPWGFDPSDLPGNRLIYVPPGEALQRRLCPDMEQALQPAPASFEAIMTLPRLDDRMMDWESLGINADEIDWYEVDEAMRVFRPQRPQHHLLGTAYQVQSIHMDAECQLTSHGYSAGDDEDWQRGMSAPGIAEGISNWRLLMQFDSEDTDDGLGPMWGDCGLLYFWIESQRLAARDFSRTCAILQCS